MYSHRLWQQSGHWQHYRDDMFLVTDAQHLQDDAYIQSVRKMLKAPAQPSSDAPAEQSNETNNDEDVMCLKPMNCPGHCLIFASENRSYRDLPMRYAHFSPLHRYSIHC
jgi:threonyl-tRNA synthetase